MSSGSIEEIEDYDDDFDEGETLDPPRSAIPAAISAKPRAELTRSMSAKGRNVLDSILKTEEGSESGSDEEDSLGVSKSGASFHVSSVGDSVEFSKAVPSVGSPLSKERRIGGSSESEDETFPPPRSGSSARPQSAALGGRKGSERTLHALSQQSGSQKGFPRQKIFGKESEDDEDDYDLHSSDEEPSDKGGRKSGLESLKAAAAGKRPAFGGDKEREAPFLGGDSDSDDDPMERTRGGGSAGVGGGGRDKVPSGGSLGQRKPSLTKEGGSSFGGKGVKEKEPETRSEKPWLKRDWTLPDADAPRPSTLAGGETAKSKGRAMDSDDSDGYDDYENTPREVSERSQPTASSDHRSNLSAREGGLAPLRGRHDRDVRMGKAVDQQRRVTHEDMTESGSDYSDEEGFDDEAPDNRLKVQDRKDPRHARIREDAKGGGQVAAPAAVSAESKKITSDHVFSETLPCVSLSKMIEPKLVTTTAFEFDNIPRLTPAVSKAQLSLTPNRKTFRIVLKSALYIPFPGIWSLVLERRVRLSLYDGVKVIGNPVVVTTNSVRTRAWTFPKKKNLMNNILVRVDTDSSKNIHLLIELSCVYMIREPGTAIKKDGKPFVDFDAQPQRVAEMNCGWCTVPINQLASKTHTKQLVGGSPKSPMPIDPNSIESTKGIKDIILRNEARPKIKFLVSKLTKAEELNALNLPYNALVPVNCISLLKTYRSSVLHAHYPEGDLLMALQPQLNVVLKAFPYLIDHSHLLLPLMLAWEARKKKWMRGQRANESFIIKEFHALITSFWPLLRQHGFTQFLEEMDHKVFTGRLECLSRMDPFPLAAMVDADMQSCWMRPFNVSELVYQPAVNPVM